jgi:autotransporter-associated beta strand protein
MDGDITGGGELDKTGSGTLTLTGNTALTGGITISAGTVAMSQLNVSQLIAGASPGTLAIGGAGTLDISIADGLGGLAFRLGAVDSGDLVTISAGKLALGDELINFDDFTFRTVTGFGQGTYDLFSASELTGSLGASLSGQVGGLDATLLLSGSSLQLQVVPEPSTLVLAVFGLGAALLVWWKRMVRSRA